MSIFNVKLIFHNNNFSEQNQNSSMAPRRRRNRGRKTKFVTKRGLPFQLMKYQEQKFISLLIDDRDLLVPATTGELIQLNEIRTGTQQFERVGNMVQVTGVYGKITFSATSSTKMRFLRVILYSPRIVDDLGSPVIRAVDLADPDRHVIWFDKLVSCPFPAAATPGGVMTVKKKFSPYIKCLYDDIVGSSITKNSIRIAFVASENVAVNISCNIRLYFKDL